MKLTLNIAANDLLMALDGDADLPWLRAAMSRTMEAVQAGGAV